MRFLVVTGWRLVDGWTGEVVVGWIQGRRNRRRASIFGIIDSSFPCKSSFLMNDFMVLGIRI